MKRCVEVEVNGKEYRLRLDTAAMKRLEDYYKKDGAPSSAAICLTAVENPVIMAKVMDECMRWKDSGNPGDANGTSLYEDMVDDGKLDGLEPRMQLIMDIMTAAGLLTTEQADAFVADARKRVLDSINGILDDGGNEDGEENPPVP